jgi:predicted Zn-dependent protease
MKLRFYFSIVFVALFAYACTRNAITGRNQLSLVSESQLQEAAKTQYRQFLSQNKVVSSNNNKDAEMVKRVGSRIANAITQYYKQQGQADALSGYKWEFNLVQGNEVNAWCMPGGKVVVYTGILPVTQNEAALAVVLGHEITHAVASHGKERMSQQLLAAGIQQAGQGVLSRNSQALGIFNAVYAPAAQVGVLLPNSRNQELEADRYGLIFAAMAGYNPEEAVAFWRRMQSLKGGATTPVFMSTHPGDEERIQKLQELMPEALKYYRPVQRAN